MDTQISLKAVTKVYRRGKQDVEVLRDLDLDIQGGEFVALMGPSGSGKTTLLNLIGGLDSPTSGQIMIDDQDLSRMSRSQLVKWRARQVGFIFQFYNLMPTLSAERNVQLPLLLTHLDAGARRRHAQAALELVGLGDRANHRPGELSGGQQQRIAIARAIVTDPALLVCDEPTGDLDRQTAEEVLGILQLLNREQGKTIVMVTHDPKAAQFASRELHLDKGALVEPELLP